MCGETRAKLPTSAEFVLLKSFGPPLLVWSTRARQPSVRAHESATTHWSGPGTLLSISFLLQIFQSEHRSTLADVNAPTEAVFASRPHRQPRQATPLGAIADVEGYS
jgi:hypothetical protein